MLKNIAVLSLVSALTSVATTPLYAIENTTKKEENIKTTIIREVKAAITDIKNREIKVATINMRKINEHAEMSKDMTKKITTKQKKIQEKLSERANKIENDFKKLESKRSILSAEEYQKQGQQLGVNYQKLQADGMLYSKIHEEATMNAITKLQEDIKKATAKVATNSKNEYDLVVPLDQVFYANNNKLNDITDEVIRELNKMSKTVNYDKLYEQAEKKVKSY